MDTDRLQILNAIGEHIPNIDLRVGMIVEVRDIFNKSYLGWISDIGDRYIWLSDTKIDGDLIRDPKKAIETKVIKTVHVYFT